MTMKKTYRIVKVDNNEMGISYYLGELRIGFFGDIFIFIPIVETKARTYDECFDLVKKYHEKEKQNEGVSKGFTLS